MLRQRPTDSAMTVAEWVLKAFSRFSVWGGGGFQRICANMEQYGDNI